MSRDDKEGTNKTWAQRLCRVWSACPTPFTEKMKVDRVAIKRMVAHHLRLGVRGLFLAGTTGEGPWLTTEQKHALVATTVEYAKGKFIVAAQVTDNSSGRILENINSIRKDGAELAVIGEPYSVFPPKPEVILNTYVEAIRQSPLPIGIYDRGAHSQVFVPNAVLRRIYEEKNVILVKDSSGDPQRRKIALTARRRRPQLWLLDGHEFRCLEYLLAGYNGLLLGGGIFNGYLACRIVEAVELNDLAQAERLDKRLKRITYAVYGGKTTKCWLTGLKKLMVEIGIFATWKGHLNFPLTESCCKAIQRLLERDADVLMP